MEGIEDQDDVFSGGMTSFHNPVSSLSFFDNNRNKPFSAEEQTEVYGEDVGSEAMEALSLECTNALGVGNIT